MKFGEGDVVLITKKVTEERGWDNRWVEPMNETVMDGREYLVTEVLSDRGVILQDCKSGVTLSSAYPHGSLTLI